MFNLYISPDQHGFKGEILDELLAKGYFRLFNKMFTSNTVDVEQVGDSMYIEPIFWLRTVIDKIKTDKKQQHIFKKCASFTTTIKTLKITPAIEKLFLKYRNHVSFDAGDIIDDYKILIKQKRPFESKMILVKEKDKLIALGIFDCGKNSIMGLNNIYDPAYSKYSLGKFLMLQKIKYAKENNIKYYYTGNIRLDKTQFDYKVFPDKDAIEVYMSFHNEWKPFSLKDKPKLELYFEENMFEALGNL